MPRLHLAPSRVYSDPMLLRMVSPLLRLLAGVLFGVGLAVSLSAIASDPGTPTGLDVPLPSQPEAPWGPASSFTIGGALLVAVWRAGAITQKVMDGGITVTVKMSDDDVELLTESLRCKHPETKIPTRKT